MFLKISVLPWTASLKKKTRETASDIGETYDDSLFDFGYVSTGKRFGRVEKGGGHPAEQEPFPHESRQYHSDHFS